MRQDNGATDEWEGGHAHIGGSPYQPPGPEDAAMHVEQRPRPAIDPGRSDESALVDDGDGDGAPVTYFDDEQPEHERNEPDDEHEPDLEELLEVQHYAFAPAEADDDGPLPT